MRDNIIGESPDDIMSPEVYQVYPDTCAIKSQQLILKDFGLDFDQEHLINEAMEMQIFEPGSGTMPEDVGKLLELHGVPVETTSNASILDLTRALAQGHKVIIGVDSGELWHDGAGEMFEDFLMEQADHALIVAGIDVSSNEVILTDPGSGAEGARYPMDKFLDAWHDSGNFMVETEQPAPVVYCPEMTGFDYEAGHIDTIGAMPWDFFENQVLPLPVHDMSGLEITFDAPGAENPLFRDFRGMVNGRTNTFSAQTLEYLNDHLDIEDLKELDFSVEIASAGDYELDLKADSLDEVEPAEELELVEEPEDPGDEFEDMEDIDESDDDLDDLVDYDDINMGELI